jgi:16S rRNA (adenine1518-N6/adenine1519-N6)-dimethyltransferase
LEPDDTVIEIGPGHGELTEFLLKGNKVFSIEKDSSLYPNLKEKFARHPEFTLIEGDVRDKLEETVSRAGNRYKLTGNIPYYLTGQLLREIAGLSARPVLCVFTVQKEVAERMAAAPPHMNKLAASVQFWSSPKIIRVIPRKDFSPPPRVDSAIIKLETVKNPKANEKAYFDIVHALFQQPRKTIFNNLRNAFPQYSGLKDVIAGIGLPWDARPQDVPVEKIGELAAVLTEDGAKTTRP